MVGLLETCMVRTAWMVGVSQEEQVGTLFLLLLFLKPQFHHGELYENHYCQCRTYCKFLTFFTVVECSVTAQTPTLM